MFCVCVCLCVSEGERESLVSEWMFIAEKVLNPIQLHNSDLSLLSKHLLMDSEFGY